MVQLGTGCSSVGNGVYLSGSVRDGVQLSLEVVYSTYKFGV